MSAKIAALFQQGADRQGGGTLIPAGYDLLNALRSEAGLVSPGVEQEVSLDLARRLSFGAGSGVGAPDLRGGTLIPLAALSSATATAGAELVYREGLGFANALRAHSVLAQLGATIVSDVSGPVSLVRASGAPEVTWLPEDATASPLAMDDGWTFAWDELPSKTAGLMVAFTRKLEALTGPLGNALIRSELLRGLGAALDAGALSGSGADNEPTGIPLTDGIGSVALAGATPTYAEILDLEDAVSGASADLGGEAFVASSTTRKALRGVAVLNNAAAGPVWSGANMLGHPAAVTNHVGSGQVIFGSWPALWVIVHGLEVVSDRVSGKKQGLIELAGFVHLSMGLLHPESFAVATPAAY